MRFFLLLFLTTLANLTILAAPGDTILTVTSHNKVHMNWNGNFDRWGNFPQQGSGPFYRVVMEYTLGCPSNGCSEWDYTTQVFLRHRTGITDSNAVQHPAFTLNGNAPDSLGISSSPTFATSWNSQTQSTDTTFLQPFQALLFQNPNTPNQATDTLHGWPALFWQYDFDSLGQTIDSNWWAADTLLIQSFLTAYQPFEIIEHIELGRVITPYSGTFGTGWNWSWNFDITDFQQLLKDSVEIRAHYGGWQDGYTVSLKFHFIEGNPPLEPLQVKKMFGGSFAYGNPNQPIDSKFLPINHKPHPTSARTDALLWITGHGFGGNENCAEFCSKAYYLDVDQQQRATAQVWRSGCGWNPIFPQGGTWVYDRANWCPGDKVQGFRHNITPWLNSDSSLVRFRMQPFTNINNNNTSYIAEAYLIDYASPTYALDVSLEDILAPSSHPHFSRLNPICANPLVRVRNNGAQTIQGLRFEYGVVGGPSQTFDWTGSIELLESQEIELPALNSWFNQFAAQEFFARILTANQQTDELTFNNEKSSPFYAVPQFPDSFILFFKSNARPNENSWEIEDAQGQIVASGNGFAANSVFRDTLRLNPGCYRFRFLDQAGDGLSFWANPNAGSGLLRFEKISSGGIQPLKIFQTDFGSGVDFSFTVGYEMGIPISPQPEWFAFPNPADHELFIDLSLLGTGNFQLLLSDFSGRTIRQESCQPGQYLWDLQHLAPGTYFLQLWNPNGRVEVRKIIVQ